MFRLGSFADPICFDQETTEAETDGDGYLADDTAHIKSKQFLQGRDRMGNPIKSDSTNFENLQVPAKRFIPIQLLQK